MGIKFTMVICFLCLQLISFQQSQAQEWMPEIVADNLVGAWTRTADFDNDGDPDIVTQDGDTLFFYENLRPGWEAHLIDSLFINSEFAWLDVFDIDGDGDIDVLQAPATNATDNTVAWNENQENGSQWTRHVILDSFAAPIGMENSYGDLDGDNDTDIAMPVFPDNKLYWLENSGNENPWTTHMIVENVNVAWSSVGDIDGDNDLDIILGSSQPDLIIWYENDLPNNTWTAHLVASVPGSFFGDLKDIDQDGDIDVITVNFAAGAILYFENPSWTMHTLSDGIPRVALGAIGDIDNDTDLDISFGGVGFGLSGDIGWLENPGQGGTWTKHLTDERNLFQRFVTGLADIDGDGYTDQVALQFDTDTFLGDARWYANPGAVTGIEDDAEASLPQKFALFQNHPNPFNPSTVIGYQLPEESPVTLSIFNLTGQKIKSLVNEKQSAGHKEITWDGYSDTGKKVSSGVYLYRLTAGAFTQTKKMVYLR